MSITCVVRLRLGRDRLYTGHMIGIDEVGRGAWAGPLLVVAARECEHVPDGLKDSKLLTKRQRERLAEGIQSTCDLGEGWVSPAEVDHLGLTASMRLGVQRALEKLKARNDEEIVIDGHINYCAEGYVNARAVIDADATHPIVSAASIYAKVLRDNYMCELAKGFPGYGFEKHVGYGTRTHKEALTQYGVTAIHRKSYKPIQAIPYEQNESSSGA